MATIRTTGLTGDDQQLVAGGAMINPKILVYVDYY